MNEPDFQNSQMPGPSRNVTVFADRRKPPESEILIGMVERLMERMDRYDERLTEHMENEVVEMQAMLDNALNNAFPEGDADGHKRHHEALIKRAEASAEFWAKMKLEITKYGLFGFLGWAGYYLWQAFLKGPR